MIHRARVIVGDHQEGQPAGNEEGCRAQGWLSLPGCIMGDSLGPEGQGWLRAGEGKGEERRGGQGRQSHLELVQHGVAALPQVGQIQALLIILEPLGQGRESHGDNPRAGADRQ